MSHEQDGAVEALRKEYEESARKELLAKGLLKPGCSFNLVFQIKCSTDAVQNQTPVTKEQKRLLKLPIREYFTLARLQAVHGKIYGLARVLNATYNEESYYSDNTQDEALTLRIFLENYTEAEVLRIPNLGRKSLMQIKEVLARDGFTLKQ